MPRQGIRWWRGIILVAAAIFFLAPILASIRYGLEGAHSSFTFSNFGAFVTNGGVRAALLTSLEIGGLTVVVVLALMVPTVVFVRLRMPKLSIVLDAVTILPIVIPPVVMAAGLYALQQNASWLGGVYASPLTALTPFYVILAMPFTYRALNTGVRAIDLRTLVDAARNLGASWPRTIVSVVLPNIQSAVLGSAFLTLALVLGEAILARLLLYNTLPVEMISIGDQGTNGVPVALSVESLIFTWGLLLVISMLGRRRGRARRRRAPAISTRVSGPTT